MASMNNPAPANFDYNTYAASYLESERSTPPILTSYADLQRASLDDPSLLYEATYRFAVPVLNAPQANDEQPDFLTDEALPSDDESDIDEPAAPVQPVVHKLVNLGALEASAEAIDLAAVNVLMPLGEAPKPAAASWDALFIDMAVAPSQNPAAQPDLL